MKATKLGIWMDHEHAHLTEFTAEPLQTKIIDSKSTREVKDDSILRGENHMHTKEKHQQAEYYKTLGQEIRKYEEVVLFGPSLAKTELYNTLKSDHLFDAIAIKIEQTDKMTENQVHAFVRKHFSQASKAY